MADRDRRPSSDLADRLKAARKRERNPWRKPGREGEATGAGIAVRAGIELAGTLAVGVGIGWLLDGWLGTGPWLLVLFFFLGAAAGVLNVYRAMMNMGLAPGYGQGAADETTPPPGGTPGPSGSGPGGSGEEKAEGTFARGEGKAPKPSGDGPGDDRNR